jgi:predicted flap endonuclease-1-like 5' DNA nuclease
VVRAAVLLALVGAGAAAWLAASPRAPAEVRADVCDFVIAVDGVLRCDDEAPRDVTALCGAGRASLALAHGDAVTRATLCADATPRPGANGWARMRGEDLEALAIPVDLNHASASELESLPGIGPELARRIVEGRPYATVDDLNRVRGIGPARLTAVRPRARVQTSGQDP